LRNWGDGEPCLLGADGGGAGKRENHPNRRHGGGLSWEFYLFSMVGDRKKLGKKTEICLLPGQRIGNQRKVEKKEERKGERRARTSNELRRFSAITAPTKDGDVAVKTMSSKSFRAQGPVTPRGSSGSAGGETVCPQKGS